MSKYVRFGSLVSVIAALTVIASACYGATITGTVRGPDGSAAKSVFVQAQNTKTKITTYVMSDAQGRYKIEKLPAGDGGGRSDRRRARPAASVCASHGR